MIQKNIQIHALESEQIFRRSDDEKDTIKVAGNCEVGRGHVLHLQRKKVTIVFVPGIMASRLVDQDNSMVWDPDSLGVMRGFWGAGPEKRQALLLKKSLSVPPQNNALRGDVPTRFPHAIERGWHTVTWKYYGKLLESLEDWASPLKAFIDMKVCAFGYNWMQSNRTSAEELCSFIEGLEKDTKIILVSHSMGGLVTRACVNMLEDKNQVLGVIHGAQPAMGAPAAYKRQKAGFEAHSFLERLVSSVLGDDGPEVRAIFPYGYGPLELLPCQYYHDPNLEEGAWFSYQTFVNGEIKTTYVPSERIYDDVYTKFDDECYYGMLNRDELMRGMKDINEFKKYKIYH